MEIVIDEEKCTLCGSCVDLCPAEEPVLELGEKCAQVVNLDRALDRLSKEGFWVIGTAPEAPQSLYRFDWKRDLVLVLGSEDRGLSRLIRDRCDLLIRISSPGQPTSLNVSVACGIALFDWKRRRTPG